MSRFDSYMKIKELNDNRVTIECGLSQGLLSQARKGKSDLGRGAVEKILSVYQDLNRVWLLTGEGDMLRPDVGGVSAVDAGGADHGASDGVEMVNLVSLSAKGGRLSDYCGQACEYDCERIASPVGGAELAIRVYGDSMSPEYPNGSLVYVKRVNERAFLEWGKVYVLDTCNGAVIKRLVPSERDGYVRCVSINPAPEYAPFEVSLEDVFRVFVVMACLSMR